MSKPVKIVAIIVGFLAFLILVVPLFLPKHVSLERSIVITAPDSVVYALVADYGQFNLWSPWYEMEPEAATAIYGQPGQVNHQYTWEGKEVGSGEMSILRAEPYSAIDMRLVFGEQPDPAMANWRFEPVADGVKATWSFESDMPYPIGRLMGTMMDSFLGPDYEKGLSNLKRVAEAQ